MTAQGNALGWQTPTIFFALKGRNMEVKNEKRIEKKSIIHYCPGQKSLEQI
jgi:hypothetical protein